jgi:hypothetical protein
MSVRADREDPAFDELLSKVLVDPREPEEDPAMTRKTTAVFPMSMAALSMVRVTAFMFAANPYGALVSSHT